MKNMESYVGKELKVFKDLKGQDGITIFLTKDKKYKILGFSERNMAFVIENDAGNFDSIHISNFKVPGSKRNMETLDKKKQEFLKDYNYEQFDILAPNKCCDKEKPDFIPDPINQGWHLQCPKCKKSIFENFEKYKTKKALFKQLTINWNKKISKN